MHQNYFTAVYKLIRRLNACTFVSRSEKYRTRSERTFGSNLAPHPSDKDVHVRLQDIPGERDRRYRPPPPRRSHDDDDDDDDDVS